MKKLFTSESVTEGHPDKLCDLISDSLLDEYLRKDKTSRVAIETVAGKDLILVTGEVTSTAKVDIEQVVRNTIKSIGYLGKDYDIDYETCKVLINITTQSPDIAQGTNDEVGGAGDQGIMFGYACKETEEYMPLAISLAHKLAKRLTEVRKENIIKDLGPDGKTQVTVEYEDGVPKRVDTIIISTQTKEDKDLNILREELTNEVINNVISKDLLKDTKILINPTGRFVIGGPLGDSGLTGRKIIVDTYGGYSPHGGGAFSGKDPTKVDRSASYMARFIAKNIVANNYADICEVELSYAIGVKEPISVYIDTHNTNTISEEEILEKVKEKIPLTPQGIINYFDLRRPIYTKTTNYGHFGKTDVPWEEIIVL